MSTVSLFAERMKERALLVELCDTLRKQNAELDELQEMHATAEGKLEEREEKLAEAIEDISKANALGVQGNPFVNIARIRAELLRLNNALEEWERYKTLVQLCMKATIVGGNVEALSIQSERAIVAEVKRLKDEEIPF
jgi:multidrug resistance efflux pump